MIVQKGPWGKMGMDEFPGGKGEVYPVALLGMSFQ